jgi:hypothetical protein
VSRYVLSFGVDERGKDEADACQQFVSEFEKRFIGSGGDVTLSYTNGHGEAMDVA